MNFRILKFVLVCFMGLLIISEVFARQEKAPWIGEDFSGKACEGKPQGFGPYDYSNASLRATKLPIVEEYHFTPQIQRLKQGKTGHLLDDIDYTLRAFPNHYKALTALTYYASIFQLEIKQNNKRAVKPAVECYFQKAINFARKDATLEMIYAVFLKKSNKNELADQHYLRAIQLSPKNLRFRYMYGLFLVDLKKMDQAKIQAEFIYSKEYPKQKLKEKLIASGNWN